jgi:TolB-like protein
LAVLEFSGARTQGEILEVFADTVRGGVVQGLARREIQVMTRENMMVLLKEMGKNDCVEGDCEVETARNIGADFVVSGSVVRIDQSFVVTLKLHES